jgi:hypothetical protein
VAHRRPLHPLRARTSLTRARRHKLTGQVETPRRLTKTTPLLDQQTRLDWLARCLRKEPDTLAHRVAAVLLLLYAQPVDRIAALRPDPPRQRLSFLHRAVDLAQHELGAGGRSSPAGEPRESGQAKYHQQEPHSPLLQADVPNGAVVKEIAKIAPVARKIVEALPLDTWTTELAHLPLQDG